MPLRAGQLNQRVRLERPRESKGSSAETITDWDLIAEVWAHAEPVRAGETFGTQQRVATGDVQFTVRYRRGLTTRDRVIYEGQEYDIQSAAPDERHEALLIVGRVRTDPRDRDAS